MPEPIAPMTMERQLFRVEQIRMAFKEHGSLSAGAIGELFEFIAAAQSSLERARADGFAQAREMAARTCEHIKNAEFGKLPAYDREPDFADDSITAEDVCAWHIRQMEPPTT